MRFFQLLVVLPMIMFVLASSSCGQKSATAKDEVAPADDAMLAAYDAAPPNGISIRRKWTMPPELLEISGISWMDDQRIACVQDERGSLFIYNLSSSKIEKEISFAGAGDYEAISRAGDHFYVMRADGLVYEIDPAAKNPVVKEINISWDKKHDIEAMSYDAARKRLLIADKMDGGGKRIIHAFDLSGGKTSATTAFEIDLSDPIIRAEEKAGKKKGGKKKDGKGGDNALQPSALAINPVNGEMYLTDGGECTLLVLDRNGKPKRFIELDKNNFPQPEGLTVSPKGEIYISSEGVKGNGVIAQVTL